jgi:L-ribulose-5-phosphate 4-epimerase
VINRLRQQALDANLRLVDAGLVTLTFGNASVIDRERGIVAIKPSGVPYEDLTVPSMVLVDLDGRQVEEGGRPSSDTATHLVLYRSFPEIGGVVHTHSLYATAFAQAGQAIDCLGTTHADHAPDAIPVTRALTPEEIGGDYEAATGEVIAERLMSKRALDYPGILVMGHGPFSWGTTGMGAVESAIALEYIAHLAYVTRQINHSAETLPSELHSKHFQRKHGPSAYYGQ